jgi:hypothetical protein
VPFTGSHPAAVLPFIRWLPSSALVIGSMAPDLPYYLRVPVDSGLTHSLLGVITADLVLGAAVFLAWQSLIGPAVVAFTPASLRARLGDRTPAGLRHHLGSARGVVLVVLALVLGAATHVVWDSFTHAGMPGSVAVAWPREDIGPLPVYEWAQYLSGLVGGAVLYAWARRWWRSHPPVEVSKGPAIPTKVRRLVWVGITACVVAGALMGTLSNLNAERDKIRGAFFLAATWGGTAGVAALTLVSVGWAIWHLRKRRRAVPAMTWRT